MLRLTEIASLIGAAVIVELILLSILEYTIGTGGEKYLVPRSLPLLDGILTFVLVGGLRFSIRASERKNRNTKNFYRRERVLIVGAGDAGVSILLSGQIRRGSVDTTITTALEAALMQSQIYLV